MTVKLTDYSFRKFAGRIHGTKYIYDLVNYTGSANKVIIICPLHGPFEQAARDHLRGMGCNACRTNKKPAEWAGSLLTAKT